jgi:saccharopine dehydrogenase-like NADP-dependent oxidoreductase
MKNVLILGAGKSSPYMIDYMLEHAERFDWFITVADYDVNQAKKIVGSHPRGAAIKFNVNSSNSRTNQIKKSHIVINFLAPMYQHIVALTCVRLGKHMISVSYEDRRIRDLENDALEKGILILTEIGLDPGIDHMSAAELVEKIRKNGGFIKSFESYGGGLPSPDSLINPLKYLISWNPRNVVMAGENGAQYMENGKIKIIPYHNVFQRTWPLELDGLGVMETYPNRDSLNYQEKYGFEHADTVIRGTIRYPGWSETWFQIMRLGLPNETLRIPEVKNKTYGELTEMFLPLHAHGSNLERRVANSLGISPTGKIMENMRWLGLFSDEKIGVDLETPAEVMTHIIANKLQLTAEVRDMVILHHRIKAVYPEENNRMEQITSTMIHYGEREGFTSMAKSVGLPAALVAKLLLTDALPLTGCHIPTHPAIYQPLMKELAKEGFSFTEKTKKIYE